MALNLSHRRLLAGLAASGLITLVTAVPAAAIPDPGSPLPQGGGSTTVVREVQVTADDDSLELLQIGLGALGGVVVAAAGAAAIGGRRRHPEVRTA